MPGQEQISSKKKLEQPIGKLLIAPESQIFLFGCSGLT
jgi:hypothetical protein